MSVMKNEDSGSALSEKTLDESPKEIPIGVSVDGEIIPPPQIFEIAEQHFKDKLKDAKGAIGHEYASVAMAACEVTWAAGKSIISLSPEPLTKAWLSAGSITASLQIFRTLYNSKSSAEVDLHRVQRVARHFEKNKDPKIMHALSFQLEGFKPDEDVKPEISRIDPAAYHSHYCIDADVSHADLVNAKGRLGVEKTEEKNWHQKARSFVGHLWHDMGKVMGSRANFGDFLGDVKDGWVTNAREVGLVSEHIYTRLGEQYLSAQMLSIDVANDVGRKAKGILSGEFILRNHLKRELGVDPEDLKPKKDQEHGHDISIDHEKNRLQRDKGKMAGKMRNNAISFVMEHAFFGFETTMGVGEISDGISEGNPLKILKGGGHIASGFMALRPMQVCAKNNKNLYDNYMSPRSREVDEHLSDDGPEDEPKSPAPPTIH